MILGTCTAPRRTPLDSKRGRAKTQQKPSRTAPYRQPSTISTIAVGAGQTPRQHCKVIAKFHYTDPTGPAGTRTDPHGLCRRPAPTQRSFAAKKSVQVRSGLVGPGRARVVEFSSYPTTCADFVWSGPVGSVQWNLAITLQCSRKRVQQLINVKVTCLKKTFKNIKKRVRSLETTQSIRHHVSDCTSAHYTLFSHETNNN